VGSIGKGVCLVMCLLFTQLFLLAGENVRTLIPKISVTWDIAFRIANAQVVRIGRAGHIFFSKLADR
jgi:hypothetical protein